MALHQNQSIDSGVVARPTGFGRFQAEISVRGSTILADEPIEVGGGGTGPTPYELLSGALAACTAMTLKLYAERKGWTLPPFAVEVAHSITPGEDGAPPRDHFARHIGFETPLDEERKVEAARDRRQMPGTPNADARLRHLDQPGPALRPPARRTRRPARVRHGRGVRRLKRMQVEVGRARHCR